MAEPTAPPGPVTAEPLAPSTTPAELSRGKQVAFTAVLGCLPLLALLLVAGAYYSWQGWQYYRQHVGEFTGTSFITNEPLIGYAARPDAALRHTIEPPYSIYSDDRGCRVNQAGQSAPGAVDLLAVGCSFTFGFGVDNPDTYVQRLAERLGQRTCNAAVPAYGTTAAALTVDRFADLAPKVILYGFIGTHEARNLVPCATTNEPFCRSVAFVDLRSGSPIVVPPEPPSAADSRYLADELTEHSFGLRDVYWAWMRDWYRLTGRDPASVNAPFEAQAADPATRERAVGYLMDQLVDKASALGARLVVVYMPIPGDVRPMPPSLAAALARHPEVAVVDTTTAFQDYEAEHGPQSLRVSATDAHPNAAAHALIAEAAEPVVAAVLREADGTPAGR